MGLLALNWACHLPLPFGPLCRNCHRGDYHTNGSTESEEQNVGRGGKILDPGDGPGSLLQADGYGAAENREAKEGGEAVSVGMIGAARIAQQMGMIPPEVVERHYDLLRRFDLPTRAAGVPVDAVFQAMSLDKKVEAGSNRWVLLEKAGKAVVRRDIPTELVEETVRELLS